MTKNKKILLTISIIALVLFTIVYTIEFVDKRINGATYVKIDKFLRTVKNITYSQESKSCVNQFLYLGQHNYTPDKMPATNKAKLCCIATADKIKKVSIPQDISEKKKIQLLDIRNDYYDIYNGWYHLISIQQKYKKADPKRKQLEYPYLKDGIMKTYYLYLKFSNVDISYSFESRIRNIATNIYYSQNKKKFEHNLDKELGKEK